MKKEKNNTRIHHLTKVLLLAGLALLLAVPAAWAVGTPSNTPISNRATISYSVDLILQEVIESSPAGNSTPGETNGEDTTFLVDNRVNVTVASLGNATVIPGGTDYVLPFSVTNTGNTIQGYSVEVVNGATNIVMEPIRIYLDVNRDGLLDAGDTEYSAGTNIGDLNPNGVIGTEDVMRILIVADAPNIATDGNTDTYWLKVTTLDAGTLPGNVGTDTAQTRVGMVDDPNAVDVVFGDPAASDATVSGQYDGTHADFGVFTVGTANLTVTKTSAVIEDPVLGVDANAKAIPGAIVEYTITIENTGSIIATGVTITDVLDANVTFAGSVTGATSVDSSGTPTIVITLADIAGGTTTTVTYQVTIN